MATIMTRMGDGYPVEMSESQLMQDLEAGMQEAVEYGQIDPLTKEELQYLFDLFRAPYRVVGVQPGNEIVLSYDGAPLKMMRTAVDVHRMQVTQIYEKLFGADTLELGHVDYSFKPVKPIVGMEQTVLEQVSMLTHAPLFYGAMPNLGLYSEPDGPFPNPAMLLGKGKIKEAQESYERAVEDAVKDIVFVASAMVESGADGINLDTVGAAGDADFLAGLKATEILKAKYPDICIELGMAGEYVLGLHAELEYKGQRLAGMYPQDQVRMAEEAGVTLFGPVVNVKTNQSSPWNLARVITFVKACCDVAQIPIHANMGMGVGGVPVTNHPPVDITTRASAAMVEICRLDGL